MKKRVRQSVGVFRMEATSAKTAEILIYEQIGYSWWDDSGVESKDFVEKLAALGDVDEITVRINSPGGDVFEGVAIYNALKTHNAKINVQIDSLAASIASVIAMAGDTITISDSAMIMIHNASGFCMGEAADMRKMADVLDKIRDAQLLGAYARTGKTPEELTSMMDAETWFTAKEAVDAGFADSIMVAGSKADPQARMKFDLSGFRNAPTQVESSNISIEKQSEIAPKAPENGGISAENQQKALIAAQARNRNLRLAELS